MFVESYVSAPSVSGDVSAVPAASAARELRCAQDGRGPDGHAARVQQLDAQDVPGSSGCPPEKTAFLRNTSRAAQTVIIT